MMHTFTINFILSLNGLVTSNLKGDLFYMQ